MQRQFAIGWKTIFFFLLQLLLRCNRLVVCCQDKAGTKPRQGSSQAKEAVQEYIAGAETVSEDPAARDYVVVRARLTAAK